MPWEKGKAERRSSAGSRHRPIPGPESGGLTWATFWARPGQSIPQPPPYPRRGARSQGCRRSHPLGQAARQDTVGFGTGAPLQSQSVMPADPATVGTVVVTASGIITIQTKVYPWFSRKKALHNQANIAKKALGFERNSPVAYRSDSVHPLFVDDLHPDNATALVAIAGNDYVRANKRRVVDSSLTELGTNLVLIGSPASEGLSQPAFGYVVESNSPDSLRLDNPPLDLPYKWVLSRNEIDNAQVRRFVAGRSEPVARPNWRFEGPRLWIPGRDNDDMLTVDYLLVTKVRNYLALEALNADKYIVSVAGAHGTGTRAVELLLGRREVLREVAIALKRLNSPNAFQLLFQCTKLTHGPRRGTRALQIGLVDAVGLPDDMPAWRTAHDIAAGNMSKWRAKHA